MVVQPGAKARSAGTGSLVPNSLRAPPGPEEERGRRELESEAGATRGGGRVGTVRGGGLQGGVGGGSRGRCRSRREPGGGRGGWEAEALEGEWADLSVVKGRCSPRGTEGRH